MARSRALDGAINDDGRRDLAVFARATGVRIAFYSSDGIELESGDARGPSAFCDLLRTNPAFNDACRACDRDHRAEARVAEGAICYECHAGLTEAVATVKLGESVLGYTMIGQIRTGPTLSPELQKRVRRHFPSSIAERLRREYASIPLVDGARLDAITTLFEQQVERLVARNEVRIRGHLALEELRRIISDRFAQPLTVRAVAADLGMGVSTLEHLLRRELGTTFTRMLRAERLTRARTLLETRDELSVAEIARLAGYDDPFYFTRLFRHTYGESPSVSRRRSRGPHSQR